ncbi:unnamed protein product [Durusdinium trenchii]|uniref:Uncharacterized protein n=1 Tax=Durusdinium trenchii TaxID=1381693 RepID=A0ABP0R3E0_9DINO
MVQPTGTDAWNPTVWPRFFSLPTWTDSAPGMSEAGWSLVASSRGSEVTLKKYGTNGRSHVAVVHLSVLVGVWAWVMEPVKGKVQKGDNSQVDPFGQKMCTAVPVGIALMSTKLAELLGVTDGEQVHIARSERVRRSRAEEEGPTETLGSRSQPPPQPVAAVSREQLEGGAWRADSGQLS